MSQSSVHLHPLRKQTLRYVSVLLLGVCLLCLFDYIGFFDGIDHYLYDLSFRIRGPLATDKRIVIASIDENTLETLGRWPIRRKYYAHLLDIMKEAKVVGFDIIMAERSDDDTLLGEAIRKHGRVVLPVYIERGLRISNPNGSLNPLKTGHVHVEQGVDGVVRKVFHTLRSEDSALPSFASAIYEVATGTTFARQEIYRSGDAIAGHAILQGEPMNINYFGPPGTFQQFPLANILEGRYPAAAFQGKIILVGLTAPGIEERMLTPFAQQRDRMTGVEVQANILNSLLARNAIRDAGDPIRWGVTAALTALCFFLFVSLSEGKATLFLLLSFVIIPVSAVSVFSGANLWIRPTILFFSVTLSFCMAYAFRLDRIGKLLFFANEEWEKTFNDIHDAIIVDDSESETVRVNRAAEELLKHPFGDRIKYLKRDEPATVEMFDPGLKRFFRIETIPRLNKDNDIVGTIRIIRDVTERRIAAAEIKKNQEQLRNLTAYTQKVAEIERTNIAREIHDELGQALTVLKIDLSWIRKRLSGEQAPVVEKTEAMASLVDRTIQTVKKISTDLRPVLLDDLGLAAAIEWQAQEFQKRTGIACTTTIDPEDINADRDRNTALFRIFQETLTNVARHAGATEVSVDLKMETGHIELKVQDNGRGITETELSRPESFGLMGIRERAIIFGGDSDIKGEPGKGTTIKVRIPVRSGGGDS